MGRTSRKDGKCGYAWVLRAQMGRVVDREVCQDNVLRLPMIRYAGTTIYLRSRVGIYHGYHI